MVPYRARRDAAALAPRLTGPGDPPAAARACGTIGPGALARKGRVLAASLLCHWFAADFPAHSAATSKPTPAMERQVTTGTRGRILTNVGAWSPDSRWLVYDTRSDAAGNTFDGQTIEMIQVDTGEVRELYRSRNHACCGVATFDPAHPRVAFILGPEEPTPEWQYGPFHRQGVIVHLTQPGRAIPLDARDLVPPFTPGALRGGSHVHVWDAAGDWVSFTYEDHVLATAGPGAEPNRRTIAVSAPVRAVSVPSTHPRNHSGTFHTVVAVITTPSPRPGSDEIARACEEGWVGTNGYVRADGTRQRRALAFQGQVTSADGRQLYEVFVVDLPEDLTRPGAAPLQGTAATMPFPPRGTVQRRLTSTADRTHPGVQGPRHWLRTSPDGSRIAFLMRDDAGLAQLWTVSPNGGAPRQVTRNPHAIASTFTWSPDGTQLAHVMDNSVCVTDAATGETHRLTPRSPDAEAPRPEACVFSPDGTRIAFVRRRTEAGRESNQICVVTVRAPAERLD